MRAPALSLKRPVIASGRIRSALTPSPRLRRGALVATVLAALVVGLYVLWLRDSSLVAVEQVTVTGVTTRDGERLRSALVSTGRSMTTLNVDREQLEQAAAVFPIVQRIEVEPDFPHGLTVHVVEHRPVALLAAGGRTVPVAADGTILTGLPVEGDLPAIETSGQTPARQLPPGAARDAAAIAGGAPAVIARRIESIGREGGARGVVAQVENGPEIVFGSPERAAAKWAAAIRVLADEEAGGATYVDVRLPERPVAGGLPVETVTPIAPVGDTSAESVIPPVDPAATAPVDPAAEAPTPVSPTPAPDPSAPLTPAAPEGTGGLTP